MAGVLDGDKNASRGVVTTTSEFAPGVWEEFKDYIPGRLELRDSHGLCEWLRQLRGRVHE